MAISEDLRATERSVGLGEHRPPDPTFAAIAHAWVAGEGFAEVVGDDELTGGDFVRTTKQLIDLLRQLAIIAPEPGDPPCGRRRPPSRRSAASWPTARPLHPAARMTIKPGEPWGRTVDRPADLVVVAGDPELARHLASTRDGHGGPPVFAVDGDLARTSGRAVRSTVGLTVNEYPIDLSTSASTAGAVTATACAHVVIRNRRGGAAAGGADRVVVVMNAEFIGDWDVAPRGHPNDGRVEVFEVGPTFGVRQRWQARRRLRSATHVPHPGIATRTVRAASWSFRVPMSVVSRRSPDRRVRPASRSTVDARCGRRVRLSRSGSRPGQRRSERSRGLAARLF